VGEIKTVLDEADIQQISMRIKFVLKIQSAVYPFRRTMLGKLFKMNYEIYNLQSKTQMTELINRLRDIIFKVFSSKEPKIILFDPQKRLEDSFKEMSIQTNNQIQSIKSLFDNQVTDVRTKLSNSQVRVEDNLNEMTRTTTSHLDILIEDLNQSSKKLFAKLESTETKLDLSISKHTQRIQDDINFSKMYIDEKLDKLEAKLSLQIESVSKSILAYLEFFNKSFISRTNKIEQSVTKSERTLFDCTIDSSNNLNQEIKQVKAQSEHFQAEIKNLNDQVAGLRSRLLNVERKNSQDEKSYAASPANEDKQRFGMY
jgi:hypothetical protein